MVKPADFQALQLLTIAISRHLAQTSPEYRRLIAETTAHLATSIGLPGMPPELADHRAAELEDAWQWLLERALP